MAKVIKAEGLSKAYQLGDFGTGTISRDLERYWAKLRGKEDPFLKIGEVNDRSAKGTSDIVWSLKDLDFEIEQGDAVGIIGRNGAGKSTLLKILSRVTSPTTGSVKVKGRVASLLEVGTGFHPELTGRENIFLNGAILGMRKAEIKKKFDEIVSFAGIDRYVDTPVKRYSSGMYVRLAFAVAAYLESEILIVDEVLAVGDAEFQKKCLGKMNDVSKGEGRTVLFVSHNMGSMKSLCKSGILLENGILEFNGNILAAINRYEQQSTISKSGYWVNPSERVDTIHLRSVQLKNTQEEITSYFTNSEKIMVIFDIHCLFDCEKIKLGFDLFKNGEIAFRSEQVDYNVTSIFKANTSYILKCEIPAQLLNMGEYIIRPLLSIHCIRGLIEYSDPVLLLNIDIDKTTAPAFHSDLNIHNHPGATFPLLKWDVTER